MQGFDINSRSLIFEARLCAKNTCGPFKQLVFPLLDLVGMNVKFVGQFRHGLLAFHSGKRHFGLESGRMTRVSVVWAWSLLSLGIMPISDRKSTYLTCANFPSHFSFAGVPRGELEAGRAFGMGRWTLFRRIWLPRAIQRALPTLNGETVLQLKSTPLVATITVIDVYAVISKVRQDTFLTYEPLLLLALIYLCLTAVLVAGFRAMERRIPSSP